MITCGALMFSKDMNEIALQPLEVMIELVNKIATNPNAVQSCTLIKIHGKREEALETIII